MEAKELRIGNLVTHTDYTESIFTVTSIEMDESGGYAIGTSGGKNGSWINPLECIEPIPLTAEWLKNNTTTIEVDDYPLHVLGNGVSMEFYTDEIVILLGMEAEFKLLHIEYVHQLQNLYFTLTGRELTIGENGK